MLVIVLDHTHSVNIPFEGKKSMSLWYTDSKKIEQLTVYYQIDQIFLPVFVNSLTKRPIISLTFENCSMQLFVVNHLHTSNSLLFVYCTCSLTNILQAFFQQNR